MTVHKTLWFYVGVLSLVWIVISGEGAAAQVWFKADFENGNLREWEAIRGTWRVIQSGDNHVVQSRKAVLETGLRTLNIAGRIFGDFTMEARIWQVSRDHGANIYFHNDQSRTNPLRHSGYWFGISGAFRSVGWGTFNKGVQRVWEAQALSDVPLDRWVRLRLEVQGRSARMWLGPEDIAGAFQKVFDIPDLVEVTQMDYPTGRIGFIVGGVEVWMDDVVISGEELVLVIEPTGKAAVLWGQLKRGNLLGEPLKRLPLSNEHPF